MANNESLRGREDNEVIYDKGGGEIRRRSLRMMLKLVDFCGII